MVLVVDGLFSEKDDGFVFLLYRGINHFGPQLR